MADKDRRKRTPWFSRNTPPVRPGFYECGVRWTSAMPTLALWVLEWDGKGFKVPIPMIVKQWRGLAKRPRPNARLTSPKRPEQEHANGTD